MRIKIFLPTLDENGNMTKDFKIAGYITELNNFPEELPLQKAVDILNHFKHNMYFEVEVD